MTIAVTGASGHLGANLVRALLTRGHRVRALYKGARAALDGLACECISADVRDTTSIRRALDGVDTLYHLAAVISIRGAMDGAVRAVNVHGVANVMRCAREVGVRRVVHCSSVHAFDLMQSKGTIDETSARPRPGKAPVYDVSKADGEIEVRTAIDAGLDAVIINPAGCIGPCDFVPSRMGEVFMMLARRQLPALVQGGFNWVDVRDVVEGAITAAERGRTGENYILSGHWKSPRQLAVIAASVTGVPAPRFDAPMLLARVGAPFSSALSRVRGREPLYTSESLVTLRSNRRISCAKATRELDFSARPIEQTIADLYAWYERVGMLSGHISRR